MRYTLSTCTQTRSLTFHAKSDDILVQHVRGVFSVLCFEFSNAVYSLYPSPCHKCNNEPRGQSINTCFRQVQDEPCEILPLCGFISEKSIRRPTRTWKSLSKGSASESNRASCCRTSLEWTNYIHVCICISATVPSTQDLYFLEAEVLEPAVAPFVLVFPSFAFPLFVSAGFRKRSTAFHGATSFDS